MLAEICIYGSVNRHSTLVESLAHLKCMSIENTNSLIIILKIAHCHQNISLMHCLVSAK